MAGGARRSGLGLRVAMTDAVRIEPDVKLQPPLVGLVDGELERIIEGLWRDAHRAAEILRPGLDPRRVEGVG